MKSLLKTLSVTEYIKFILGFTKYKNQISKETILLPKNVFCYKIKKFDLKIKSPSLRLLKQMKTCYFTDSYISELEQYFNVLGLSGKSTIVDVGANIGYLSTLYSIILPKSKIYSFEPSYNNYLYLEYHASQRRNIKIYNYGFHDKRKDTSIQMPTKQESRAINKDNNNTGLLSIYGTSGRLKEKIKLFTLDQKIIKEGIIKEPISFIKIDVEGNELKVLMGSIDTIKLYNPIFEIEINESALSMSNTKPNEIFDFMKKLNYQPYTYDNGKLHLFSVMERPVENIIFKLKK